MSISSYSNIVTNWQILIKFLDASCASLKSFGPFGRNDRGGSCSGKKCYRGAPTKNFCHA